jgi:uncharacterized membrane protein YdjX (TVP38/TMEM64 family)
MSVRNLASSRKRWLAGALAGLLLVGVTTLPLQAWVGSATAWLAGLGPAGMMLFAALTIAASMVLIPSSLFALVAGFTWGPSGLVLIWAALMASAALSFQLSKHALRAAVRDWLASRPGLRLVTDVVEDEGWRILLLIRFSGVVPFGAQNYAFGTTRMRLPVFLSTTTIGVLPSLLLYGMLGVFGRDGLEGDFSGAKLAVLGLSIAAVVALVGLTGYRLRQKLAARRAEPATRTEPAAEGRLG